MAPQSQHKRGKRGAGNASGPTETGASAGRLRPKRKSSGLDDEQTTEGARPRKRGRPINESRRLSAASASAPAAEPENPRQRESTGRRRRESNLGKAPVRRPSGPDSSQGKGKQRAVPPSSAESTAARRRPSPPPQLTSSPNRTKPASTPQSTYLAPQTTYISLPLVEKKWRPLPPRALAKATALLTDAASAAVARTAATAAGKDAALETRRDAAAATTDAARRLIARLRRGQPFPTDAGWGRLPAGLAVAVAPGSGPGSGDGDGGGWDDELTAETDHESSDPAGRTKKAEAAADSLAQALDRDRIAALTDALQRGPFGVEPLRHSVRLLEAERDRCEAALEADYALLARLERDAAREATELRKTVGRGRHALLRRTGESGEPSDDDGDDDGATMRDEEDADTRATGRLARLLAELEADSVGGDEEAAAASKEVLDLARQAASHMESMRANLAQAAGIPEAVAATHAALRLVLSRHLDAETYESVVLG